MATRRAAISTRTAPDAGPKAAVAAKAADQPVARRVLIVDDNIDAAETLAMMLQILGQQTAQAHDGHKALTVARDFRPEVVFMDIGLPGLSGHEAASRMRKDLGMEDVFLIALSGYGTEQDRRKSMDAGFDNHLVKPLDPAALPGILASASRQRQQSGVV